MIGWERCHEPCADMGYSVSDGYASGQMRTVLTDCVTINNTHIVHFDNDDNMCSFKYVCPSKDDYAANLLNQCKNPRAHSSFAKPVNGVAPTWVNVCATRGGDAR